MGHFPKNKITLNKVKIYSNSFSPHSFSALAYLKHDALLLMSGSKYSTHSAQNHRIITYSSSACGSLKVSPVQEKENSFWFYLEFCI